ncbi:MAG: D-galactarate dehydratase/Altronate hydrolase domain protein [Gemmatimonadetes bacterium]|jgi:altronate hydrolase|nr:D-galactarate dehydratase/Altronate hydrolase domain protein [Gemmatimonadota bacterium]
MSANRPDAVRVHADDNVAVAIRPLAAGESVEVAGARITLRDPVPAGHKIALRALDAGEPVVKYGFPIGQITAPVAAGGWIHSHNLRTRLEGMHEYSYQPAARTPESVLPMPTFEGYRRADGRVGTRNEVWILNTVGCVNFVAEGIAKNANAGAGADESPLVHAFGHPFGCSQLGDDLQHTQAVLAGLLRNPNAGGVLVLGLGCENNQMDALLARAGDVDRSRIRFFNSQDVGDERESGLSAVGELLERMRDDRRVTVPASELVIGHKCGGSDGFSGISANAVVGRVADRLSAAGGGVILTEVPEMFGAEQLLMNRATSEPVFRQLVAMINDFKAYFIRHGQSIYENPSPGNKAGGLTTLEEKSLGAIQKGGQAPVARVLRYGEPAGPGGLSLLEAPGNDGVSSTAMVASGATVLLFTTGRGTPLGFPVPTIKISSNSEIAAKKPHWIDFNAGALLDGTRGMDELASELFAYVLDVASGSRRTNNEVHGYREIAIWKDGVTL